MQNIFCTYWIHFIKYPSFDTPVGFMKFKPKLGAGGLLPLVSRPFSLDGGGWSIRRLSITALCCLDLYVLYQAADRRARPQWLVIQSSAQILWRRRMTSCLLFPQVHLRGEYGTFMALSDAFYGFIMEFPTEFQKKKEKKKGENTLRNLRHWQFEWIRLCPISNHESDLTCATTALSVFETLIQAIMSRFFQSWIDT